MAKYGEPIDQYERYRTGAHGIGVFEKRNFASPTCIGCHGSHAALPPAVPIAAGGAACENRMARLQAPRPSRTPLEAKP